MEKGGNPHLFFLIVHNANLITSGAHSNRDTAVHGAVRRSMVRHGKVRHSSKAGLGWAARGEA